MSCNFFFHFEFVLCFEMIILLYSIYGPFSFMTIFFPLQMKVFFCFVFVRPSFTSSNHQNFFFVIMPKKCIKTMCVVCVCGEQKKNDPNFATGKKIKFDWNLMTMVIIIMNDDCFKFLPLLIIYKILYSKHFSFPKFQHQKLLPLVSYMNQS